MSRRTPTKRVTLLTVLIPSWFHVYFFFCLLWFRFYRENAWILWLSVANLSLGLLVQSLRCSGGRLQRHLPLNKNVRVHLTKARTPPHTCLPQIITPASEGRSHC